MEGEVYASYEAVPLDLEILERLDELPFPAYMSIAADQVQIGRGSVSEEKAAFEAAASAAGVEVFDRDVAGPVGAQPITLTVVRARDVTDSTPGMYMVHGGGMVFGTRYVGLDLALRYVVEHGITLVSVEYRLAPEHPAPAGVEDAYVGLVWTAEHADELGIDRERLLVFGSSAGGGIAAGITLMARDRDGPDVLGAVLMCPMIDDRDESVSSRQHERTPSWDRSSNRMAWTAVLGDRRGGPDVSPYVAPARAVDVSGLPQLFIDCGSAEVFRDEAVAFASAVWAAGGRAELHVWPGGFHGFEAVTSKLSAQARSTRDQWILRVLGIDS